MALALAAITVLVFADRDLPLWLQLVLWTVLALGVPAATAGDWFGILGPLLFYELLRCARRDRYVFLRGAYALVLLGVLCWCYLTWLRPQGGEAAGVLYVGAGLPPAELSKFAGRFFTAFLAAQLTAVLLLTPVYVGGAIAEEKQGRTLEFLLATDLSSAEIVVSKLAARLVNLGLLVLTGLPVLALTELWGGVDPLRLALGFAVTALTMGSVGSLSMLNSVLARHPLAAVLWTYGELALFLALGGCLPGLNFGHPLLALFALGGDHPRDQTALLGGYTTVHLAAASLLLLAAVQQLRTAAWRPGTLPAAGPTAAGAPAPRLPRRFIPPLGDKALLWKELHVEPHSIRETGRLLLWLFVAIAGFSGLGLFLPVSFHVESWAQRVVRFNVVIREIGTIGTGLLVVLSAFYAAGRVSRERERQTLDGLRTLPDDARDVLSAKWLGGFLSVRHLWWCLGVVWGLGVVTGALNVLAVPLLLLACAVYTGFAASLGLYCSTVCRSTVRATVATLLVLLILGADVVLLAAWKALFVPGRPEGVVGWVGWCAHYGLTGLLPLWVLAFRYDEFWDADQWGSWDRVVAALAGLACYAVAAWVLWRLALARFRALAGPVPHGSASRR
jgi:ABC-type transport system involved in multi-copper enzyme maturation permease subunit